jgi:hypothetical protein
MSVKEKFCDGKVRIIDNEDVGDVIEVDIPENYKQYYELYHTTPVLKEFVDSRYGSIIPPHYLGNTITMNPEALAQWK